MPYKRPSKRRPSWIRAPLIALGVLFVIAFYGSIRQVFSFLWSLFKFLLGVDNPGFSSEQFQGLSIIAFNVLLGFLAVFFLWLFLISTQALLPVKKFRRDWPASRRAASAQRASGVGSTTPRTGAEGMYPGWAARAAGEEPFQLSLPPEISNFMEELRTAWHLFLYILHLHGPAVFVRDGQIRASLEELSRNGPGVAVIDFNSAAVFEEMVPPPGLSRPVRNIIIQTLIWLGLSDPLESPRARGAGIVFMRRRERIRGAVDLRRQFRIRPGVPAYTRDGIEVKAAVWILFTIGQDPEVREVAYVGDRRPENLRVITLEHQEGGRVLVKSISDDIEDDDRNEINHFFWADNRRGQFWPYAALDPLAPLPVFDPTRVFAAVSSQARNAEEQVVPWDELPVEVAAASFRDIVQKVNYNEFFEEASSEALPLMAYKAKQRRAMVNNGVLAYRHIRHHADLPLQENTVYRENELRVSMIRPLTTPKILRDRGIKIIASGFGELVPVDDSVYRQRLESWRAPWQKDVDIIRARQELEAMRIRSRARADATRDLTRSLAEILQRQTNADEITALRVLQALEAAAADPHTRQLLPGDTIALMRTLHDWLLPNEPRFQPPTNPTGRP